MKELLDLLRDPVWQFVGVVLTVLTIGITIWIYRAQMARRRLLVEHMIDLPLMSVGKTRIPGLGITWNGQSIDSANVVIARVENIGNSPFVESDFSSPLTLLFEKNAEVLDARVTRTSSDDLSVLCQWTGNQLSCSTKLLNPGDYYMCRALVRNSKGSYKPQGRVVGLRRIETSDPRKFEFPIFMILRFALIALSSLTSAKLDDALKVLEDDRLFLILFVAGFAFIALDLKIADHQRHLRMREELELQDSCD